MHMNIQLYRWQLLKKRHQEFERECSLGGAGGRNGRNNVNTELVYEILKKHLNKNRGTQIT